MFEFLNSLFFPCQCYECRKARGELTEEERAEVSRNYASTYGSPWDGSSEGDYHWPC